MKELVVGGVLRGRKVKAGMRATLERLREVAEAPEESARRRRRSRRARRADRRAALAA